MFFKLKLRGEWCTISDTEKNVIPSRKLVRNPYVEAYVLGELEVISVHPKVVHDEGVVHVVWEVCRDRKVTEAHHLLGGVDDDRVVDAGPVRIGILLQY